MTDAERIRHWRKSPLAFIQDVWGLSPQPLKPGIDPNLPAEQYKLEHFEPFLEGKHVSWQQWLILRAAGYAMEGKASRRISIRSGRGIGKSATCSWLLLWFLFCFKDCQIPCTAPTYDQIHDVLWRQVAMWIRKMPPAFQELYTWQESYIRISERPASWFARARTGKKENPDALAGVHSDHVMMIVDEASGVAEEIYQVAEGNFTNDNILVILISNPRRLSGYFFLTHHANKHLWQTLAFDSRESPVVKGGFVEHMRSTYGEDSPQWEIEVRGNFPLSEENQFIGTDLFDEAAGRTFTRDLTQTRALGVDVATFGDDSTALSDRQGNVGALLKVRHGQDTMATTGDVMAALAAAEEEGNPFDFVCVDVIGIGRGVYDRLKELQRQGDIEDAVQIIAVNVSEKPFADTKYVNRTAELWDATKTWLKHADVDPAYKDDLCGRKYGFDSRGRLQMEKKDDMKERGLPSPDKADSLVITFAVKAGTREKLSEKREAAIRSLARTVGRRRGNGPWWVK